MMATARSGSRGDAATRAFEQRIRGAITALLADRTGAPGLRRVAERLTTSVRTLQRRLRATGATYAAVLQEERCAAAMRLLQNRTHGIGDVARALGYSEPAHFTRAFQRWIGSSPSAFRRRA